MRPNRLLAAAAIVAVLTFSLVAFAQKPPATAQPATPPTGTWTVARGAWIGEMSSALPPALCDQGYFNQCFTTSVDQCLEQARIATEACLGIYASMLPEVFVQPNDGSMWGQQIGECVGVRLESAMMNSFTNTALCNDPTAWY